MDAQTYTEDHQVPGPGGRWVPAPPPEAPAAAAAAANSDDGSAPPPRPLFHACHRSYPNRSASDAYVWIELEAPPASDKSAEPTLLGVLRRVFPTLGSLYDPKPGIDARSVYVYRAEILAAADDACAQGPQEGATPVRGGTLGAREASEALVKYVESQFAFVAETIATYPPGMISYHLLWHLLRIGEDLEAVHDTTGERIAIQLDSWAYVQETMGRALALTCHFYQWAGTCYHRVPITRKIREFSNLRSLETLPVFPLTAERRASLRERGDIYQRYAGQVHANHSGFFFTRAFTGVTRLSGDGQVVIDVKGYRRSNPALDTWTEDTGKVARHAEWSSSSGNTTQPCPELKDEHIHLLPPSLHGFSLRAKRWGEFLVSRLSPIGWSNESFSHLVIPDSYRRIVKALVTVQAGALKDRLMIDVVEGKGNGLVMAFHGPPGTGKTLTAEAIAEHLRRPLYVVSAGELGILPQVLETQLRNILELATQWNAVLLIDEADIFLQKRDANHLERNALTGVFLRLLEYFTGVLILTTNSIQSFDDAFLSRFAVVLHFDELDAGSRRTLWERFLARAASGAGPDCDPARPPPQLNNRFDLDRLASFRLNGREIKHAVQTAQAVALVEEEELEMRHIEEVVSVARSGVKLLGSTTGGGDGRGEATTA
ncbi:hypothetical protein JCM8202_000600 [Rhodotorula sphaerocarpa]